MALRPHQYVGFPRARNNHGKARNGLSAGGAYFGRIRGVCWLYVLVLRRTAARRQRLFRGPGSISENGVEPRMDRRRRTWLMSSRMDLGPAQQYGNPARGATEPAANITQIRSQNPRLPN